MQEVLKTNRSQGRKIMCHYLIFLAIVPITAFQLSKMFAPGRLWLLTGLAAGLVVAPVSQGLVEYTLIPLIGGMLGLVGALFNFIHGSVGYLLMASWGIFGPNEVLDGFQITMMNLVNGAIWTTYYGVVGYRMDLKLSRSAEKKCLPVNATDLRQGKEC